ncbi:MAG: hypothetical protein II357_04075 [Clostridia bacterium]|nr:hypothetical protein [Clostridia bacterium]
MGFLRRKKKEEKADGKRALYFTDHMASAIFQEILKDNKIPFICRQTGAGGYLKHITGGLLTTDEILFEEDNFETAEELYRAYFESEDFETDEE